MTLIEDVDLALAAGLAGARVGLEFHRRVATLARQEKADGSLVTQADLAVEEEVKRVLARARPGDAFLGEETGSSGRGRRRWVLDGIDGTLVFVRGDDRWQTLLALELDGEVVVAVAVVPAQGRLWWAARGRGAWLQEFDGERLGSRRRLHVATTARVIGVLPPPELLPVQQRGPLLGLAELGALSEWSAHAALLVASGEFGLAVQIRGRLWDYAALTLIVQEAGGQATGHDGRPYPFPGTAVFSADPELHRSARRHLRGSWSAVGLRKRLTRPACPRRCCPGGSLAGIGAHRPGSPEQRGREGRPPRLHERRRRQVLRPPGDE